MVVLVEPQRIRNENLAAMTFVGDLQNTAEQIEYIVGKSDTCVVCELPVDLGRRKLMIGVGVKDYRGDGPAL